jgi:hypothetical protein
LDSTTGWKPPRDRRGLGWAAGIVSLSSHSSDATPGRGPSRVGFVADDSGRAEAVGLAEVQGHVVRLAELQLTRCQFDKDQRIASSVQSGVAPEPLGREPLRQAVQGRTPLLTLDNRTMAVRCYDHARAFLSTHLVWPATRIACRPAWYC